jgi:acyl-CoA thioester hydrolase
MATSANSPTIDTHQMQIRVRYCEVDQMGFLHHANYFNYFEMGRTELFRAAGGNYAELESRGFFLVIVKVECQYKASARYDDVLTLTTRLVRATGAKLEHEYEVHRHGELLTFGRSILACVNRQGQVQRIDDALLFGERRVDAP